MIRHYKFKLNPSKIQAKRLKQECFVAKQIFDILLNLYKNKDSRELVFSYSVNAHIKDILTKRNLSINSKVLQQSVRSFCTMITARSKLKAQGIHVGELKFKKFKDNINQSFKTCGKGQFKIERISHKKGILSLFKMKIPVVMTRDLPSIPKTLIISFDGIDFFASFSIEVPSINSINGLNIIQNFSRETSLGIDLNNNSVDFGTDKKHFKYKIIKLKQIDKTIKKLENLGRKMAKSRDRWERKKEEKPLQSENYKKIEKKFKKLHRKVARQRQARILDIKSYFIKIMLDNNLNQVAMEDLDVKKMTNKENVIAFIGTKKSKQMRKNLLSVGYGKIREEIEDACVQYGWRFHKVDPKYTSKQCACCGEINKKLKITEREYKCSCGWEVARDYNACINILSRITG
jgi:putative transposase